MAEFLPDPEPGAKPSDPLDPDRLVRMARLLRWEAADARRTRMEKNRKNFDAVHARQDWSHTIEGQSREFLPKTSTALEQFTAVIKKALTSSKDWYMPVLGRSGQFPLSDEQARALLDGLLSQVMVNETDEMPIQLIIPD